MSAFKGNGNKVKGNKGRKGGRGKKEVYADFNENTDQYGKLSSIQGGKHASVLLLGDSKTPVAASFRGIHHRKVWMNPGDYVIVRGNGNIYEIWGKVPDSDMTRVRREFEKQEGDENSGNFIFRRDDEYLPDDNSDSETDEKKTAPVKKISTKKLTTKTGTIAIPDQPERNYDISKIDTDETGKIDFDSI